MKKAVAICSLVVVGLMFGACQGDGTDDIHRIINDPAAKTQLVDAILERHDVLDLFYARIMADERATKHLIREFCGNRRTAEWILDQMMDFPEARDAMVEKLIKDDEMREKMAREYELFRRP